MLEVATEFLLTLLAVIVAMECSVKYKYGIKGRIAFYLLIGLVAFTAHWVIGRFILNSPSFYW